MAYVTFFYGNNETEFPKRLHVVQRGCIPALDSRSYAGGNIDRIEASLIEWQHGLKHYVAPNAHAGINR
jgi:hypothetical protein